MKRSPLVIGSVLLGGFVLFYFALANANGDTGSGSFATANYLGLAAVVTGLLATILLFRNRVRPPR